MGYGSALCSSKSGWLGRIVRAEKDMALLRKEEAVAQVLLEDALYKKKASRIG